jgi:peptidoglycan/xylan/chitin deacetylase (PgdA/CDA1 family)
MDRLTLVWFSILLSLLWSSSALAQNRTVAITVDDLPYASADAVFSSDAVLAKETNGKILSALRHHHAPVTGFVVQKGVEDLGPTAAIEILRNWTKGNFDLGNHTYSHQVDSLGGNSTLAEAVSLLSRDHFFHPPAAQLSRFYTHLP